MPLHIYDFDSNSSQNDYCRELLEQLVNCVELHGGEVIIEENEGAPQVHVVWYHRVIVRER